MFRRTCCVAIIEFEHHKLQKLSTMKKRPQIMNDRIMYVKHSVEGLENRIKSVLTPFHTAFMQKSNTPAMYSYEHNRKAFLTKYINGFLSMIVLMFFHIESHHARREQT